MLDFIGFVAGFAALAVIVVTVMDALSLKRPLSLVLTAGFGAWIGLAVALSAGGYLEVNPNDLFPLLGTVVFAPLVIAGAAFLLFPNVRTALTGIPMPVLMALNTIRSLGFLFILLATVGRLGGPFPYSAGIGDITTGVFAAPLALMAARTTKGDLLVAAWNLFGTLDLVTAVALGIASANGSPIQLIHAGAGSEAMQHLPYSLVPAVLVPFFLITHGIIAAQLVGRRREAVDAIPAASAG
jgi:hypothetical protein